MGWDISMLHATTAEVDIVYRVDRDWIFRTGLSMGCYGILAWAAAHPRRFAAILPICGGGDPALDEKLRVVPTWAFHGANDRVIPPNQSRAMTETLDRLGADTRLTIYPGVSHGSWTTTHANPQIYGWFLKHRRGKIP